MLGDTIELIENEAFEIDHWPILLVEIRVLLVFAIVNKAKMIKLRVFYIFQLLM